MEICYQDLGECISCFDFSPMGDYFAAGLIDETVCVWKYKEFFENGGQIAPDYKRDGHQMGVVDIKFNADGNKLAVSSLDSIIRTWNIDDEFSKISECKCDPMGNWKICFQLDGITLLTSGEQGKITVYNVNSGNRVNQIDSISNFSTDIIISKDDKFVASGNQNGKIFLFDPKDNWKKFAFQDCHNKYVRGLSFTQDSLKLVSVSDDQTIKVFDLKTQKNIKTLNGHSGNINAVDCSPSDDNLLATCSYDKSIKLWDLRTNNCIQTINYHTDNIWSVKYNKQGDILGSACENGILAFHSIK